MRLPFTLFALFILISVQIIAQTGRVSGKIVDSKTGETLPGATVVLEGTTKGVSADFDGNYSMNNVPVGKVTLVVSFISYDSKKISGVVVKEKDETVLNVQLAPSTSQDLVEVVVAVEANKESQVAAVLMQKNNISVSDGISAETIKRTPDKSISDVLKRVSGASIQDNKFAIVRGLNERYNTAYLNGAPLPSSESDRKAFAFDIFPSNMLDNLVITKTARPDMPGEFAGGIIDISTKNIPEKHFVSVSVSGGYNNLATGKTEYYNKGGSRDWLGIDDGTRSMPAEIPAVQDFPTNPHDKANLAQQVPAADWGIYSKKFSPNYAGQLAAGYNFKLKDRDFFGVLASVTYNKTNSLFTTDRTFYATNFGDPTVPNQIDNVYEDKTYSEQVLAGALLNLSCKINPNHSISSKNLISNNSDNQTIIRTGTVAIMNADPTLIRSSAFWFTSNQIKTSQLIGDHYFPAAKIRINWTGSFSDVKRTVPDLRRNTYQRFQDFTDPLYPASADTTYQAVISNTSTGDAYGGVRFWSSLHEDIKSGKADISRPFKVTENFKFEIKAGGQIQQRRRDFTTRQFGYTKYKVGSVKFIDSLLTVDQSQIFSQQNMGANADLPGYGGFKLTEATHAQDSYNAASTLKAGYLMFDVKFKNWLRAVVGARVESYNQQLTYPDPNYNITLEKITKDTTVTDVLPSANLIFSLNEKQNIRLSYSQTLNRPEFREIAPFAFFDFNTQFLTTGNDTLTRAKITNYDLRYEIYPGRAQLFSISGFYKDFLNPIEQIARTNANEISYANFPKANCYGAELEYRIIIGSFFKNDSTVVGKILDNLTLFTNFAYIRSEVDISSQPVLPGAAPRNTRTLQGQSPYIFNAGLSYIDNEYGYSLNAIVNRIGQRIYVVGNSSTQSDIWENGRTVLDLQASKSLIKNKLEIRFTLKDALAKKQFQYFYNNRDADTRFDKNKDEVVRVAKFGTTYSLQLTFRF